MKKLLALLLMTPIMVFAQTMSPTRLTPIHPFHEVVGALPGGALVDGEDGMFYGVTAYGSGVVYRITPAGALTEVHVFNEADGFSLEDVIEFAFAPEAPTNVTASATSTSGTAEGEIRLTWDAVLDATTYDVYRGTTSGSLSLMSNGAALTVTNILVTGLTPGVQYYFAVVATNEAGMSARSAEASAIPAGLAAVNGGAVQPANAGGGGSLGALLLALLTMLAAWRLGCRGA